MSRWRQFARALKERTEAHAVSADCADSSPNRPPIGTNGTNGAKAVSQFSPLPPVTNPAAPLADPAAWSAALATIDASRPPAGFDCDHWRNLLADAQWLSRQHGRAAAALGWDASALFGIGPRIGWGGLADRLEGARNLVLTDRVAHWRGADLEGWLWRESMRPMRTLWAEAEFCDALRARARWPQ